MLSRILLAALTASLATAAPSLNYQLPPSLSVQMNGSTSTSFISAAWYPGWLATNTSISHINWLKYNLISWSFAVTTPNPSVLSLDGSGAPFIPEFVQQAHDHGTLAGITVGGWTGSEYFSTAVTPQNRSMFVQAVLNLVKQYDFDGINFDWEYPNALGIGCNQMSSSDVQNFIAFLQELRAEPAAQNLLISAAVSDTPFLGPDGNPMTNLSDFAAVLDHLAVMNYDVNGQWSNTTGAGPNAPLDDSCSTVKTGSAIRGINAWTAAGFPKAKLLLGVPAYGHSYNVAPADAVDSSGNLVDHPHFTPNPLTTTLDQCGNPEPVPDQIDFSTLISQGFLNSDGTPATGIRFRFDNCSQTPFLYDENKQLFVSYDDTKSFAAKGQFIVDNDLLGFYMWEITGDSNDLLVDAILTGAAVTTDC